MDNLYSVLITLITIMGSVTAWKFYERRFSKRERDDEFIRTDFVKRIAKLEQLLIASSKENNDLRIQITDLSSKVAELTVKVTFLTEQNESYKKKSKIVKRHVV